MDLITLCESLKARAEDVASAILTRWSLIGESEEWLSLPDGLDFDHLPALIRQLAAAALCTDYERSLCEEVVHTALLHGAHRAEQGFGENLIHREYHLMRRALGREMTALHGETADVYYATMRVQPLISVTAAAALRGVHHREDATDDERWHQIAASILDEWPLPTP